MHFLPGVTVIHPRRERGGRLTDACLLVRGGLLAFLQFTRDGETPGGLAADDAARVACEPFVEEVASDESAFDLLDDACRFRGGVGGEGTRPAVPVRPEVTTNEFRGDVEGACARTAIARGACREARDGMVGRRGYADTLARTGRGGVSVQQEPTERICIGINEDER